MASELKQRGPERTGIWQVGSVGLGHTLLATTPEAVVERLPLLHTESGCVITGDIRLDNRSDLLRRLGLSERAAAIGDGELVLWAYLNWEENCVERLLGDFAFAIWDPRSSTLFCARDHMGVRSLYYHHAHGRTFAFATGPRAILVLSRVPYRINETRIADYLVEELEGVDKTSTFFEEILRLPPAHSVTVSAMAFASAEYWALEPGGELRLDSREAYAEAFLDVFTEAVRCRSRTAGQAASTLSGGIDSGSIVGVARRLLIAEKRGPLLTLSAVSPEGEADPETRAILETLKTDGLDPYTVSFDQLTDFPELLRLAYEADEPFDASMTLIRTLYLAARRQGVTVLIDGAGGDTLLSEGHRVERLLRSGAWRPAYREAAGRDRFWGGAYPPRAELMRSARAAFVPRPILGRLRPLRVRAMAHRRLRESLRMRSSQIGSTCRGACERLPGSGFEARRNGATSGLWPSTTPTWPSPGNGMTASAVRSVSSRATRSSTQGSRNSVSVCRTGALSTMAGPRPFCESPPQTTCQNRCGGGGGKEHLGWAFTVALMGTGPEIYRRAAEACSGTLRPYVRADAETTLRASVIKFDPLGTSRHIVYYSWNGGWSAMQRVQERNVRGDES